MDVSSVGANSRVVSGLAEAGGAIGIVCGLLLVCMFLFFRHLMEVNKMRDAEMANLQHQLQEALISNASALVALTHLLQQRPCLCSAADALDQICKDSKTVYLKKRSE